MFVQSQKKNTKGMLTMAELNTVTIPLEDYIELRRKADETIYLANQLGEMNQRYAELFDRICRIETKVNVYG